MLTKEIAVPGRVTRHTINDLKPYTVYNATIVGSNSAGQSMSSYGLLVLTHAPSQLDWERKEPSNAGVPALPDTKACCRAKNVTHQRYRETRSILCSRGNDFHSDASTSFATPTPCDPPRYPTS